MEPHSGLLQGLVFGLVTVVAPHHLGTLLTLSSAASYGAAFRVGMAWGLGHSCGTALVAAVLVLAHQLIEVDVESWEHYGNYLIGASMMLCALYFVVSETSFVMQEADGSFTAQPCCCHGGPAAPAAAVPADTRVGGEAAEEDGLYCKPCTEDDLEVRPLLPASEKLSDGEQTAEAQTWWQRSWAERDAKGALLGIFQGACCPMGMLGVSFLANLPSASVAGFLIVFMLVSAFGTATLAVAWAFLTAHGLGTHLSPRAVYRASCGFTMALGVVWIICNYYGVLDMLDYTEGLH
mmetsp:Transcript_146925/g.409262  ORF Transcript_146925/g.409262 Transcript_146925/m.409262 type:complete len:293 (-) Transcript_146925:269-1147(-)